MAYVRCRHPSYDVVAAIPAARQCETPVVQLLQERLLDEMEHGCWSVLISVGLCGQSFSAELLDRMLSLNGCGCNSGSRRSAARKPAARRNRRAAPRPVAPRLPLRAVRRLVKRRAPPPPRAAVAPMHAIAADRAVAAAAATRCAARRTTSTGVICSAVCTERAASIRVVRTVVARAAAVARPVVPPLDALHLLAVPLLPTRLAVPLRPRAADVPMLAAATAVATSRAVADIIAAAIAARAADAPLRLAVLPRRPAPLRLAVPPRLVPRLPRAAVVRALAVAAATSRVAADC